MSRLSYALLMAMAVVTLVGGGCRAFSEANSPEETIQNLIESANRGDFATTERYLTERILARMRPGDLHRSWQPGQLIAFSTEQRLANTAIVDLSLQIDPQQIERLTGIPAQTLMQWVEDPPVADPGFQPVAQTISRYLPWQNQLIARMRFTLYRQQGEWRVEYYEFQPINSAALAPPPLTGPTQPFRLRGTTRNVLPEGLGVNITDSSDNLIPYQQGWVLVSVNSETAIEDNQGNSMDWQSIPAGAEVTISGQVQFGAEADAAGRIPATIRAERIQVSLPEN